MKTIVNARVVAASIVATPVVAAAQNYDLLIQGGHVIDPRSGTSGVRDVAVAAGKSPLSLRRSIRRAPPKRSTPVD